MKLSKKSKELMLFFTKNNHINKVVQTRKTNDIILELYKDIYNAYKYLNNLKQKGNYYNITTKKIVSASQISKPQNFNSNSFPDIIRKHIDELSMSEIIYSFSLYDRNIKLYFIVEEDNIVYDLTTEDDHSYTVAGMGVSNCTDPSLGFKEFWFPSWENPMYNEQTDQRMRNQYNDTEYTHEIMADWGTVEMGVFDWTYFNKVFSYRYNNNAKLNQYEYRLIELTPDDIRKIGPSNLTKWLKSRFTERNGICKYWFGADLGYSADPSEFVVFEEFNGVMKMVLRIHMEHLTYDIQADLIAFLDIHYQFSMLGMDAGNSGQAVAQILQSKRTGWNKFAAHRFDKRLLPIPFGGRLEIDRQGGRPITEPAKQAMTNMIIYHAEQRLLVMPGLDYDASIENQFRNHTYSIGNGGNIVYSKGSTSPDHIIDAVRTAFYAKSYSNFGVNKKQLPAGKTGRPSRNW
jgi:hypothetical protein